MFNVAQGINNDVMKCDAIVIRLLDRTTVILTSVDGERQREGVVLGESIENYSLGIGSGPSLASAREGKRREIHTSGRSYSKANKWGRRNEAHVVGWEKSAREQREERMRVRQRRRNGERGCGEENEREDATIQRERERKRRRQKPTGRKVIVEGKLLLEELSEIDERGRKGDEPRDWGSTGEHMES